MIKRELSYGLFFLMCFVAWSCSQGTIKNAKTTDSNQTSSNKKLDDLTSVGASEENVNDAADDFDETEESSISGAAGLENDNSANNVGNGGSSGTNDISEEEVSNPSRADSGNSEEDSDAGGTLLSDSGAIDNTEGSDSSVSADTGSDEADGGPLDPLTRIIFLHHSTGGIIWDSDLPDWIQNYNSSNGTSYQISDKWFPSSRDNYPHDYWYIWASQPGTQPYSGEKTLETLTQEYEVIVFKHCFPVSSVVADSSDGDINSSNKTIPNYELQYNALKSKLHTFPNNRFILWTGAALREVDTTADDAQRAKQFFAWVINSWDEPGDNIFIWDFRTLETDGTNLYLAPSHASGDSHPNSTFGQEVAPLFGQRLVDVIEGRGDSTSLSGL